MKLTDEVPEGFEVSDAYFLGTDSEFKEVEVTEDLYIVVGSKYLDIHSRQLDTDGEPGVLVAGAELDELIEALMQLRKELEDD